MRIIYLFEIILLAIPTIVFLVRKPRARGMRLLLLFCLPTPLIVMMAALQCRWLGLITVETGLIMIVMSYVLSAAVFLITNQQSIKDRAAMAANQKEPLDVVSNIAVQKAPRE